MLRWQYVGSAGGSDKSSADGSAMPRRVTAEITCCAGATPKALRFSILERTSPDLEQADLVALEDSWKERLHTREFGLKAN